MMSYATLLILAATITAVCLVGPALSSDLTEKATKLGNRIKNSGKPETADSKTGKTIFWGKITSLSVNEKEIIAKMSVERIVNENGNHFMRQISYPEPKPFTVTMPLPDAATCNVKPEFSTNEIPQYLQNVFGAAVMRKILDEP